MSEVKVTVMMLIVTITGRTARGVTWGTGTSIRMEGEGEREGERGALH